jgi:hypothetical protein
MRRTLARSSIGAVMEWTEAVLLLAAVGVGVWRFAVFAGRIESDSEGMVEGGLRRPYGSKWLSILRGDDED